MNLHLRFGLSTISTLWQNYCPYGVDLLNLELKPLMNAEKKNALNECA